MEIKEILYKSLSKISFTNGIYNFIKRADARVVHAQKYLILTDNILVFDRNFNLTKKYNLIGRF